MSGPAFGTTSVATESANSLLEIYSVTVPECGEAPPTVRESQVLGKLTKLWYIVDRIQ